MSGLIVCGIAVFGLLPEAASINVLKRREQGPPRSRAGPSEPPGFRRAVQAPVQKRLKEER